MGGQWEKCGRFFVHRSQSFPRLKILPKCSLHSSSSRSSSQKSSLAHHPNVASSSKSVSWMASSENNTDRRKQSLLSDIVQAQLALWTLVITVFYSYAWQQHRKKFLVSLFVVVPPVLLICCTLSSLLTAIVILGRLFSTPLRFQDILRMDGEMEESDGSAGGYGSIAGSGGSGGGLRKRTMSGASCHSCGGSVGRGLSVSCEELPKPMCRKHSGNGSCLSLFGSGASNGGGPPPLSASTNGTIPGSGAGPNSLISRSDSIGGGQQNAQRLAHQYSHFPSFGIQQQ